MLVYILIAILMFGVLIAVHELGHFLAAKSLGVKVNEFAIGMGPALLSRQRGETRYTLRALPIGGFCAMEGEEEDSNDPRSFHNKPAWKKFLILVAGAFMNFLTGFVIILVLFSLGQTPAAPVISGFLPGAEAVAQTGLRPGDEFYRIDGHRIYFQSDAILFLGRAGETVEVEVLRDGERLDLGALHLPYRTVTDENGQQSLKRGILVGQVRETGPLGTLRSAWYQSVDYARTVWISLGDLVTGAVGLKDMSGAIGIIDILGQAGQAGAEAAVELDMAPALGALLNILSFVAFIAINLAVMNLLPIPALDGGQILFLVVDRVGWLLTRRHIPQKYLGYINAAGLLCLLALMVVVAVNDVIKLF